MIDNDCRKNECGVCRSPQAYSINQLIHRKKRKRSKHSMMRLNEVCMVWLVPVSLGDAVR